MARQFVLLMFGSVLSNFHYGLASKDTELGGVPTWPYGLYAQSPPPEVPLDKISNVYISPNLFNEHNSFSATPVSNGRQRRHAAKAHVANPNYIINLHQGDWASVRGFPARANSNNNFFNSLFSQLPYTFPNWFNANFNLLSSLFGSNFYATFAIPYFFNSNSPGVWTYFQIRPQPAGTQTSASSSTSSSSSSTPQGSYTYQGSAVSSTPQGSYTYQGSASTSTPASGSQVVYSSSSSTSGPHGTSVSTSGQPGSNYVINHPGGGTTQVSTSGDGSSIAVASSTP